MLFERCGSRGMSAAQDLEDSLESIAAQVPVHNVGCRASILACAALQRPLSAPCNSRHDVGQFAKQVPGLRGVFVSDRDGVPILCHSSLPHPQSPARHVLGKLMARQASLGAAMLFADMSVMIMLFLTSACSAAFTWRASRGKSVIGGCASGMCFGESAAPAMQLVGWWAYGYGLCCCALSAAGRERKREGRRLRSTGPSRSRPTR